MNIKNFYKYSALLLLVKSSIYALDFDFKTFGTIGAVYNDSNYIYRKDIFQKDGSTKDISFKTDSIAGLQTSLYLNDNLSIIAQGILKNDYDDEIRAKLDWAYIKYDTNENISLKVGRIRTPYYNNSENLNIGYSNLMIRESVEVYGQVPFSSFNGAMLKYTNTIGNFFYALEAGGGIEKLIVPIHSLHQDVNVDIDDLYTLNLTFGTNIIEFRATYLQADISATNASLNYLFSSLKGAGLNELASKYEFVDKKSKYLGYGVFIDYNNIIFNSEYGQRRIPSYFADVHGYYATLGYNFEKTIPFITYAKSKMDVPTYEASTPSADLNAILRAQNLAQSSTTLGVKQYINKNIDIKLQYEHIVPKGEHGSYHLNTGITPHDMNVFSFAMDFIF